jgi:hypothetical protein
MTAETDSAERYTQRYLLKQAMHNDPNHASEI